MDKLRKFQVRPDYAVDKTMLSKSSSKQKQSDEIESLIAEYLDNGGVIDKRPSSLDNEVPIKCRLGENGGLM